MVYCKDDPIEMLKAEAREGSAEIEAAARAMLTALKHARTILMTTSRNRASENLVGTEITDAIAQAEAAGIGANPDRAEG